MVSGLGVMYDSDDVLSLAGDSWSSSNDENGMSSIFDSLSPKNKLRRSVSLSSACKLKMMIYQSLCLMLMIGFVFHIATIFY